MVRESAIQRKIGCQYDEERLKTKKKPQRESKYLPNYDGEKKG